MICPEQGRKIEGVNQGGYFKYLVPNQEQVFILSAVLLYPNIGQVPSLTGLLTVSIPTSVLISRIAE